MRLCHFPAGETKSDGNSVQTAFAKGTNVQLQNIGAGALQMREDWITARWRRDRREGARGCLCQPGQFADEVPYGCHAIC